MNGELEMILSAINQLGEQGVNAFIWWLIVDKGVTVLLAVIVVAACMQALRFFATRDNAHALAASLRRELKVGSEGYLTDGECAAIMDAVRKLKEQTK